MFRYRQQRRHWAALALFLWLLGIGASIANACVAAGPVTPTAAAASHAVSLVAAHHDQAVTDGPGGPTQNIDAPCHRGNLSQANCQDFCDKAAASIPPLKSALDDGQLHAVIAPTAMTVVPMPAFVPVQLRVPRRDGVLAPPIPIAFLRLAL